MCLETFKPTVTIYLPIYPRFPTAFYLELSYLAGTAPGGGKRTSSLSSFTCTCPIHILDSPWAILVSAAARVLSALPVPWAELFSFIPMWYIIYTTTFPIFPHPHLGEAKIPPNQYNYFHSLLYFALLKPFICDYDRAPRRLGSSLISCNVTEPCIMLGWYKELKLYWFCCLCCAWHVWEVVGNVVLRRRIEAAKASSEWKISRWNREL